MAKIKCPHCGQAVTIQVAEQPIMKTRSGQVSFENTQKSPFRNAAAVAVEPPEPAYREIPAHLPTKESHVVVPLWQSVITAGFCAPIAGVPAGLFAYKFMYFTGWSSLGFGLACAGGTFLIVASWQWWSRLDSYNSLLWSIEEFFDRDLDGDQNIGQPEPRNIAVTVQDGTRMSYADLPGDEKDLFNFAHAVINGVVTFSEEGASSSGYSVRNFKALRDTFLNSNWCVWNNEEAHNQGLSLTLSGLSVLRQIASKQPPVGESDTERGMSTHYIEHGSRRESWA
jgi:hypothetical protein